MKRICVGLIGGVSVTSVVVAIARGRDVITHRPAPIPVPYQHPIPGIPRPLPRPLPRLPLPRHPEALEPY
jgi:hypothetical protein